MGRLRRVFGPAFALAALVGIVAGAAPAQEAEAPEPPSKGYEVFYDVRLVPTERAAKVVIRLGENAFKVKWLSLRIDPERHFDFQGDGEIVHEDGRLNWTPPESGGELRYTFLIDHLRDDRSYDARCTSTWALFRGDDLVPPARVRTMKGARSRSRMRLRVPEGWSRATPYPLQAGGIYRVSHPKQGFDRPTGWMVAGDLGAVRETVNGVEVAVAGPVQHGMRRHDILAMLRWTFPSLEEVLGEMPPRLLVVGAGDPMWRGGLSGPRSVYVHARRPLIGEDGTSPLLHEVMHAMLGLRPGPGGDWVVEGLAEFYSLELLRRSGTLSEERVETMYERLETRGRRAKVLETDRATGDVVARSVTVMRALDQEIRSRSEGAHDLDDVASALAQQRGEITTAGLREVVAETTGVDVSAFLARVVNAP